MSEERTALKFSDAELVVLREKYNKFTQAEFEAFLAAAARYQLNPLANQIYARLQPATQRNARSVTYAAQIDGYRLIADRTGFYAGNDDPIFDSEKQPHKATVAVYKFVSGQKCKFEASARWDQYCPTGNQDFMWKRMPHLMLGKCAEALALRKAFPAELSGLYTVEEMQQADDPDTPQSLPDNERNPFREQQQQRADDQAPTAEAPPLEPQETPIEKAVNKRATAIELASYLTEKVGKHPVKEFANYWKEVGVAVKKRLAVVDWSDPHKAIVNAVLDGVRNQLKHAGPTESSSPAGSPTPAPDDPAAKGDPAKAPSFERLAGWIDQQESAASLAQLVASLDVSPKFVDLRADAIAMAKVIDHALELLHRQTDAEAWAFDDCSVAGQEIHKIKAKYDTEAQSIETFGNTPDPATPAAAAAG